MPPASTSVPLARPWAETITSPPLETVVSIANPAEPTVALPCAMTMALSSSSLAPEARATPLIVLAAASIPADWALAGPI